MPFSHTMVNVCFFVDNQVRLQLFSLAYNLGNFLRRLALPKTVMQWSLRVEVRQRNDSPWPNSCFDYYFGRNSLKMKLESLSF